MNKKNIIIYLILILVLLVIAYFFYYNRNFVHYKVKQQKLENIFTDSKHLVIKTAQVDKPVPTKLIIPKIDFKLFVIYAKGDIKSQMQALRDGPVHYGGTALPGQKGNILIGGHYVWYTFKYLNKLKIHDLVKLQVPGQSFKYKVIKTIFVKEDQLEQVKKYGNKKERLLTLYTCVYPSKITHKRIIVVCKQFYP